jgi:hypothetical protein
VKGSTNKIPDIISNKLLIQGLSLMLKLKFSLAICLGFSITINIILLLEDFNRPTHKLGKLKNDISISSFSNGKSNLIKLPKGMIVMDNSPQGIAAIGTFNMDTIVFPIVIEKDLVDYSESSQIENKQSVYNSSKG